MPTKEKIKEHRHNWKLWKKIGYYQCKCGMGMISTAEVNFQPLEPIYAPPTK